MTWLAFAPVPLPDVFSPGPAPGSRGNGLPASRWVVLAELHPQAADALLVQLADAGVAAYASPAVNTDPLPQPPRASAPRDRLWVEAGSIDRARRLLRELTAEELTAEDDPRDLETAWQQALASLGAEPTDGPARPELASATSVAGEAGPDPAASEAAEDEEAEDEEAEDEHFVPPSPPPLPRPKPVTVVAMLAIILGLVLLLDPLRLGTVSTLLAVAGIVGGCATLVYRMREGPPADVRPEDPGPGTLGPDDGAVL